MKSRKRAKLLNRSPEETRRIREAVFKRSGGYCECGCRGWIGDGLFHLDHFLPRGRHPQTVATCWALSLPCDLQRTRNAPSAAVWLHLFKAHAEKYGYATEVEWAESRLLALKAKGLA